MVHDTYAKHRWLLLQSIQRALASTHPECCDAFSWRNQFEHERRAPDDDVDDDEDDGEPAFTAGHGGEWFHGFKTAPCRKGSIYPFDGHGCSLLSRFAQFACQDRFGYCRPAIVVRQ